MQTPGCVLQSPPTVTKSTESTSPQLVVFRGDSFDAARWAMCNSVEGGSTAPVAVLDFASDTNPGGGWKGNQQGTQEESLCRRSNLGVALEALSYPIPTLGVAYVPNVCVFRETAGQNYKLLAEPFVVSVIAGALRGVGNGDELDPKQAVFVEQKIDGVLSVAIANGHKQMVLGAWGCGAFGNPVKHIAKIFGTCLCRYDFERAVFAIPGGDNLDAFKAVFADSAMFVGGQGGSSSSSGGVEEVFESAKWEFLGSLTEDALVAQIAALGLDSKPPTTPAAVKENCKMLMTTVIADCLDTLGAAYPVTCQALKSCAQGEQGEPKCAVLMEEAQEVVKAMVAAHAKEKGWTSLLKKK
eukprot:TRINITY_DN30011_c0_g1_i1.p1 TRINITY_DN30011_c0_g1~~TRINITY_DN30011_c0_g1_i1.p1  ORF type:complete len:404 (+),score=52.04 TRINITY_DN30011_c0_g1_i1:150-1214(+)